VSKDDMRKWGRVNLLLWGFTLFTALTYHAVGVNYENHRDLPSRYFWWEAARLDSDPMNSPSPKMSTVRPCPENADGCVEWNPETIWVEPSLMERDPWFLRTSGLHCRYRYRYRSSRSERESATLCDHLIASV
jgi:hypothetical protein